MKATVLDCTYFLSDDDGSDGRPPWSSAAGVRVDALDAMATVRLDPSWLATLFGARPEVVELTANEHWHEGEIRWRSTGTRRDLRELKHGALIREALERRPIGGPPAAIARSRAAAPRVRQGDRVAEVDDPRGGVSVVVARVDERACGTALGDETPLGSVLVDVSPAKVHGGARGIWMRVGSR